MRTCVGVCGVGAYLCWSGWSRCVLTCVGVGGVSA